MNSLFHFVMIFEFIVPLLEKQQELVVPPSKKCVIPPLENSLVLSSVYYSIWTNFFKDNFFEEILKKLAHPGDKLVKHFSVNLTYLPISKAVDETEYWYLVVAQS